MFNKVAYTAESDKLCRINTMFEDLILAIYLLITILQRFFANAIAYSICHFRPVYATLLNINVHLKL